MKKLFVIFGIILVIAGIVYSTKIIWTSKSINDEVVPISVDEESVDETSVDEESVDEESVDETSVDENKEIVNQVFGNADDAIRGIKNILVDGSKTLNKQIEEISTIINEYIITLQANKAEEFLANLSFDDEWFQEDGFYNIPFALRVAISRIYPEPYIYIDGEYIFRKSRGLFEKDFPLSCNNKICSVTTGQRYTISNFMAVGLGYFKFIFGDETFHYGVTYPVLDKDINDFNAIFEFNPLSLSNYIEQKQKGCLSESLPENIYKCGEKNIGDMKIVYYIFYKTSFGDEMSLPFVYERINVYYGYKQYTIHKLIPHSQIDDVVKEFTDKYDSYDDFVSPEAKKVEKKVSDIINADISNPNGFLAKDFSSLEEMVNNFIIK